MVTTGAGGAGGGGGIEDVGVDVWPAPTAFLVLSTAVCAASWAVVTTFWVASFVASTAAEALLEAPSLSSTLWRVSVVLLTPVVAVSVVLVATFPVASFVAEAPVFAASPAAVVVSFAASVVFLTVDWKQPIVCEVERGTNAEAEDG